MSLNENFDKGQQGAKRSSWSRVHYRDLAYKICREHPDAKVEDLAEWFLEEVEKHPEYLESIAVYIMANAKTALTPRTYHRETTTKQHRLIKDIAKKAAGHVLMHLQMPNGKTLDQSTGAECKQAGGWFIRVGEKVGDKGIVSQKLTEAELRKLLKK